MPRLLLHVRSSLMHQFWHARARGCYACTILLGPVEFDVHYFISVHLFSIFKLKKKIEFVINHAGVFFLNKLIQIFNCHDRCICSLIYVSIMLNASSFCLVFNSTCKHISFFFWKGGGVCILLQDTFNSLSFYFILYLAFRILWQWSNASSSVWTFGNLVCYYVLLWWECTWAQVL